MPGRNQEGYSDPTASVAISHVAKEKRRDEERTLRRIIYIMRSVAAAFNFEIVGRITLKDKGTGRIYR
jgi:hypothetical protein